MDYFRSEATGFPSIRLSDAILADRRDGGIGVGSYSGDGSRAAAATLGGDELLPEGARPARLGPAPGDPWFEGFTEHYSRRRWRRLEMRFTDFDNLETVTGALREFSGEYALQLAPPGAAAEGASAGPVAGRWSPGDDVVAHFWRRAAFDQVVGKIGGGVRGGGFARARRRSWARRRRRGRDCRVVGFGGGGGAEPRRRRRRRPSRGEGRGRRSRARSGRGKGDRDLETDRPPPRKDRRTGTIYDAAGAKGVSRDTSLKSSTEYLRNSPGIPVSSSSSSMRTRQVRARLLLHLTHIVVPDRHRPLGW